MAEVFLATVHGEAGFTKPVVIKRLHERFSEDESLIQMFVDEARLTAQLMHGNICQVLDLGMEDGSFFMAMEFIAGEDVRILQDHANRQSLVLPVEAAVFITCEVLAGLDYAQRKEDSEGNRLGIIHRDISPQNILISYEGEVKVIDFGIAKARTRAVQTEAGVIKGKFRYMSPEQASGRNLDHRSDLFSAAVVLYELLIGRPHSMDLPDTEVLYRMRQAEFAPVGKQRKGVPSKLEKMLKKALRRKPEQRYATAAEFRSDLLDLAQKFKWRFGNVEMSSVMHGVFDAERRRKRNHSWSGEMVPASATPAALGSAPRFPARSGQGQDEVMNLGDQDLEDWGPPSRLPGPLDELPTTNLDDEKTQAIPDDEETRAFRIPAAAPAPGPAAAPRATPAPVPVSNHEPTRRVSAGAFSRNEGLPPPVKKPQRSFMNAHQGTRPAADPAQAATAHAARPAHEAPYQPPVRGAGSGLRTLAGTLLVLALGGALVFWLYTENPAFLGLGPPGKPIPSAAPAPSKLDTGSSKVRPKPKRAAAVSGKGLLHIRSNPTGARIYYCGKATGKVTPARLRIKPGAAPCTIKLTLKGHEPYSMPAPDHSPRPITLVATLRPRGRTFQPSPSPAPTAPAPAKPSRGKLRVTSIQPGSVIINGQQVGQTPRLELKLRPGTYHVTVQFPSLGKTSPRRVVKIKAGKTSSVHVESE